jgi:RNA polymerase sigma factor (sigma-70 family)
VFNPEQYIIENRNHLYKQAYKLAKRKELAEDFLSQLVIIILTNFKYKGDNNTKSINTYCWGILLNIRRDYDSYNRKLITETELGYNPFEVESTTKEVHFELPKTFYENELMESGYTQEQAKKLSNIKWNIKKLAPHELNLYKMYFEQRLSLRKIGDRVGLSHSAVYYHINLLKDKLKGFSETDSDNTMY